MSAEQVELPLGGTSVPNPDPLTPQQRAHLDEVNKDFVDRNTHKYIAGQKEHGGDLYAAPADEMIMAAREEVLDLWNYLDVLERRLRDLDAA